jgi:hypothetical protein
MDVGDRYFLLIDDNITPQPSIVPSPPLIETKPISSSQKALVHRLVFPARLGRMVFYRRILSDSDIYQKNCSKDDEIYHNVYHLDTIRDYSMEFYMLTTYGSDSELRAWIDSNDDEIVNTVCNFDENRFQTIDNDEKKEMNENEIQKTNSIDSLMQEEELDWYSELEVFNILPETQRVKEKRG